MPPLPVFPNKVSSLCPWVQREAGAVDKAQRGCYRESLAHNICEPRVAVSKCTMGVGWRSCEATCNTVEYFAGHRSGANAESAAWGESSLATSCDGTTDL